MSELGWIKLHRKIRNNPIYKRDNAFRLFIELLLLANHETHKFIWNGEEIEIKRGQLITGRKILSKNLGINERTLYDNLKFLSKIKNINIKTNNKNSLITIVNYEKYQDDNLETNSKTNNKPTTSQQQTNTYKNDKNDKNEEDTVSTKNKNYQYSLQEIEDCGKKNFALQLFNSPEFSSYGISVNYIRLKITEVVNYSQSLGGKKYPTLEEGVKAFIIQDIRRGILKKLDETALDNFKFLNNY